VICEEPVGFKFHLNVQSLDKEDAIRIPSQLNDLVSMGYAAEPLS
jgi:hypothetical protein